MNLELEEIEDVPDEVLKRTENEISLMIGPIKPLPPSEKRIQSILERARLENVAKECTDFALDGVGKGVKGVLDTLLSLGSKDDKPKRSY